MDTGGTLSEGKGVDGTTVGPPLEKREFTSDFFISVTILIIQRILDKMFYEFLFFTKSRKYPLQMSQTFG